MSDPDYLTAKPSSYPWQFDYNFLEMMRGVFEVSQIYPLNPRDLSIQNAFFADMDFVNEFNLHMHWHRYMKDKLKPKKGR